MAEDDFELGEFASNGGEGSGGNTDGPPPSTPTANPSGLPEVNDLPKSARARAHGSAPALRVTRAATDSF